MKNKVVGALQRLENSSGALAIRSGLVMLIPVLLIGAAALVLRSFPIHAYQTFINTFLDSSLLKILNFIFNATFGMLSVFVTATVSYSYAREKEEDGAYIFGAVLSSLMVFFILVGVLSDVTVWSALGVKGMFTAILSACVVSPLYFSLARAMPAKRKPYSDGADSEFSKTVGVFAPMFLIAAAFALLNTLIAEVFRANSLHELFINAANALFEPFGRSLAAGALFVFISSLLWFFGIHGSDVLEAVMEKVFTPAVQVNAELAAAGKAPTEIFTKEFFDIFVLIGGCGTALCLLLAILLFSKRTSNRSLSTMAALPMLFNINEVMIFGLPVIFNPTLLIPFILTPLVSFFISYAALSTGLVPLITSSVEWTTPVLIGGYQATGSFGGSVLQLVNVIVGVFIYRPFILAYDREKDRLAHQHLEELVGIVKQNENNLSGITLTELPSAQGEVARALSADLVYDMDRRELTMYYQPQYNSERKLVGAEALLRWFHPLFGAIYPPLIIQLAREAGRLEELEERIIVKAVGDAKKVWGTVSGTCEYSINVSAETLCDPKYHELLGKLARQDGVIPQNICLEITEQTAFLTNDETAEIFKSIREMGYRFAIDDFSMGHTSLTYLQENRFDLVKLDGSIVRGIRDNPRSREIVASIIHLSKSLGFEVLAEYVETEKMRSDLEDIGCFLYQGYLFSPAVPADQLIEMFGMQ